MASNTLFVTGFGEVSADERRCIDALDLATHGNLTDAYMAIEGIAPGAQQRMRREFVLLFVALESAYLGVKGRYKEAARKAFSILGELERSVFRSRLAWLYSAAGFWLGVLGDPERGLEWSGRAMAQRETQANSASRFALLCNHGSLLGMMERYEESIPVFLQATDERIQSNPNEKYVGLHNLALCWLEWAKQSEDSDQRRERAQQAAQLAEDAINAVPHSANAKGGASATSTYCNALVLLGQYENAKSSLASALQKYSANIGTTVELMVCMAQTLRSLQDLAGAVEWLDKAESLALEHNLELGLDKVFETRVGLEEQAHHPDAALKYAKSYATFIKNRYKRRLRVIARNAEVFADAERARWQAELRTQSQIMGEKIAALDRQRSLGQMSATLGHELNQPLTAIQTSAQTLQRSFAVPGFEVEKQARLVERIIFNTRRAAEIILKIRNFIKPTQSENVAVDFNHVVRDVVELLRHDAMAHHVQMEVIDSQKPSMVMGDPIQLSQVLVNLARNAFEAMEHTEKRVLRIAVLPMASEILVRIQDTGPGFSEQTLAEAGTPFFTSKSTGLGIGLSISRDILKLHNGTLKIGNAETGGALLEIRLPRRETMN